MKKQVPIESLPDGCVGRTPAGYMLARAFENVYYEAHGQSHYGNQTKRDGKRIQCGHQHDSEEECEPCLERMKKNRPGNCQRYRTKKIWSYELEFKRKEPT